MPVDSSGRLIRARTPAAPARIAPPTPAAPPAPPMRFPDLDRELHFSTIAGANDAAKAAEANAAAAAAQRARSGVVPTLADLQLLAGRLK